MSLVVRKQVFGVSDQVPHKPGCTATEDGLRLEISGLDRRGIALSMWRKNKGTDQLRGYREADLRLWFRICKKPVFSRHGSYVHCITLFKGIRLSSANNLQICCSELTWNGYVHHSMMTLISDRGTDRLTVIVNLT